MSEDTIKETRHKLISGAIAHKFSVDEQRRGGRSLSPQKSISAKLRKYNNPGLTCSSCKSKCLLWIKESIDPCLKGAMMQQLRDAIHSPNPSLFFDELIGALSELGVESKIQHEDALTRIKAKKGYTEKLAEIFRLRFIQDDSHKKRDIYSPEDLNRLMADTTITVDSDDSLITKSDNSPLSDQEKKYLDGD